VSHLCGAAHRQMLAPMSASDSDLLKQITELVDEEHRLRDSGGEAERIRHLEEQLDQCWDLLRQRRAKREFAEDPDEAAARSTDTVEHYQQ
jgi:hypothetical protein